MSASKKKTFYPWLIFGTCFLMIFVALGFGSSTKGTFLTAVCGQLGLDRAKFTVNDSLRFLTTGIMALFLGKTVEKIGLRRMAGLGFLFLTASFTVYSFAGSYAMFYLGGALLGAGLCWTTTSMVGYIVENWFTNGKGTVMGILLAANGLGGLASEFIVTRLIYGADLQLEAADCTWRTAYRVIAAAFLAVGILAFLVIRDKPSDVGLAPLGAGMKKKKKRGLDWEGIAPADVYRKPYFWISAVSVFATGLVLQSLSNISKPYMYDVGLEKSFVVYVFAAHWLVLMIAKTVSGISYDVFGMRKTHFLCCIAAAGSMLALFFLTKESTVLSFVYSFVSSFGMPLETVMIPLTVSYLVGKKAYKSVFGCFYALNMFGYALGVPLANLFYEKQGTYKNVILIMMILILSVTVAQQVSFALCDRERKRAQVNA